MESTRISASFPDVSELGRAAGFDLGFRQLDSGPASVEASLLRGEHLGLVRLTLRRAYHQLGAPPVGMKSFGIPMRPLRSWLGGDYPESSILPFNLPGGIDGVSESGFDAFTLSVSDGGLRSVSEAFQVPVSDTLLAPGTNAVIANGEATQRLRRVISEEMKGEHPRFDREREEELTLLLLQAASSPSARVDTSSPAHRARAISKAMEYIHDRNDAAITVGDLCRNTGVALRTLNRAFRERFGVGPKAYLVRQRLSVVRAVLVRAPERDLGRRRGEPPCVLAHGAVRERLPGHVRRAAVGDARAPPSFECGSMDVVRDG